MFKALGGVTSSGGDVMSSGDAVVSGISNLTVKGGSRDRTLDSDNQVKDVEAAQGNAQAQGGSGRVQHSRPIVGMETSVLFNEWEKGWFCFVPQ